MLVERSTLHSVQCSGEALGTDAKDSPDLRPSAYFPQRRTAPANPSCGACAAVRPLR